MFEIQRTNAEKQTHHYSSNSANKYNQECFASVVIITQETTTKPRVAGQRRFARPHARDYGAGGSWSGLPCRSSRAWLKVRVECTEYHDDLFCQTKVTRSHEDIVRFGSHRRLALTLAARSLATLSGEKRESVVRGIEILVDGRPSADASTTIGSKANMASAPSSSSCTTIAADFLESEPSPFLPASMLMYRDSWRARKLPARFSLEMTNARKRPWCADHNVNKKDTGTVNLGAVNQ